MATKSAGEKTLPFRYQFAAGAVAGISEVRLQRDVLMVWLD
jgi:hypothetical protein